LWPQHKVNGYCCGHGVSTNTYGIKIQQNIMMIWVNLIVPSQITTISINFFQTPRCSSYFRHNPFAFVFVMRGSPYIDGIFFSCDECSLIYRRNFIDISMKVHRYIDVLSSIDQRTSIDIPTKFVGLEKK
jgi:hypothetical protein